MGLTASKFKKRRTYLEMSQFDVATEAKVSRYNLSLFENGHRKLTKKEEERIETVLTKKEGEASHGTINT